MDTDAAYAEVFGKLVGLSRLKDTYHQFGRELIQITGRKRIDFPCLGKKKVYFVVEEVESKKAVESIIGQLPSFHFYIQDRNERNTVSVGSPWKNFKVEDWTFEDFKNYPLELAKRSFVAWAEVEFKMGLAGLLNIDQRKMES